MVVRYPNKSRIQEPSRKRPESRNISLLELLGFFTAFAVGCGFIGFGLSVGPSEMSDVTVYFGSSILSATVGGIFGLVLLGRKRVVEGMVVGWLLMLLGSLSGIP